MRKLKKKRFLYRIFLILDKQADENSPANLLTNNNQNDCNTSPINLTKSIAHDLIDEMSHEQLTNLINRLETVTSRLETVAASSASQTSLFYY